MSERQTKAGNQEYFAKLANWSLGHAEQHWKWQCVFLDSRSTLSCEFRVHWAGSQLKNVWTSDKSWEPDHTLTISHSLTISLFLTLTAYTHSITLDMLNNFCFHLYAQKSLSHSDALPLTHSLSLTLTLFQSLIHSLSTCWTSFVFISMLKIRCL